MSWLPFYNSWLFLIAIVSLFFWKLGGVLVFLALAAFSIYCLVSEVFSLTSRYIFAFWLFLVSEGAVFATLFTAALWNEDGFIESISEWTELPILGSFLLLGSSLTATTYHHCVGMYKSHWLLVFTMVLGSSFVMLQLWEFYDCECDLLHSVYHASSFCTVGLHFSHVLFGVLALVFILRIGLEKMSSFYINLIVWYWHFVDYVWLFVFFLIYVV